jgi:hypothetical protein
MSTNLGPELPQALLDFFSGQNLRDKMGLACVLVTQGADNYPHPAIVTPGEIVAGDASTMRLALYAESSASRNLRARGEATICHAQEGAGYYIKGDVEAYASDVPALKGLAVFTFHPKHVLKDAEPGAQVTSGFRFSDDSGTDAVVTRWEPIVSALRSTFA